MLEAIEATQHAGQVLRLVNQVSHVEALQAMGLDADAIEEMLALLRERGLRDDPNEMLDGPFAHKPFLSAYQTRFSDGSVRVFYAGLETTTVEQEIRYWYLKPILEGRAAPIRMYYRLAECTFAGQVKDLRPKVEEWPFLVSDDGYAQCNQIGAEAAASGLAGLFSRSARSPEGTTVPVFSRASLSNLQLHGFRVLNFDPASDEVAITPFGG
jgi:hypothetical protein